MSKQLIKILAICAVVILCPVVIVAVALTSTEAVGCTLTIFDGGVEKLGEEDFGGKSSKVTIMVDGKAQESNKVKLTKRTEVTVTYEGVGYDFVGWFKGNYNEINREGEKADKAVSDKTSYTFEISKNTVLTAVRDVKSYEVIYSGFYDDGESVVDLESETLEYNQPLTMLTPKIGGVQTGWYNMVDGVGGVTTKVANFENSGEVAVYPAWENQMLVEYYKGNTVISTIRLFESQVASYQLLTEEQVAGNITAGYKFEGWVNQSDIEGAIVTGIAYDTNGIKLVLKESPIAYTLNVKFHALSNETTEMTYSVKDGFSSYSETRENYTFIGFEFEGIVYTDLTSNGEFAKAILTAGEETAEVTAVWECDFNGLFIDLYAIAEYEYNSKNGWYELVGTNGGNEVEVALEGQPVNFVDAEGADNFDVNASVYEYLMNAFTNVKTLNGEAVQYAGEIDVRVEGFGTIHTFVLAQEELTFAEILSTLGSDLAHGTLEGVNSISIEFIFEVV